MKSPYQMVFQQELLEIIENASRAFGFRMAILDADFREAAPLRHHPVSDYCRMIQHDLGLLESCRRNDRVQCEKARQGGKPHIYTCHAGLAEAIYPLLMDRSCIGYILVGQFRLEEGIPGGILKAAAPACREDLQKAHKSLEIYEKGRIDSVLKLLMVTVNYLLEHKIVSVRQNVLADKLREYVLENIERPISVEEVTRLLHRSISSINQSLKAVTGKSFKQFSLAVKMERAAELLLSSSQMTVAEVASRVGMEDPFYFSRIFHKHHGVSPRAYRTENRGGSDPSAQSASR